jgi:hypothetical protein
LSAAATFFNNFFARQVDWYDIKRKNKKNIKRRD